MSSTPTMGGSPSSSMTRSGLDLFQPTSSFPALVLKEHENVLVVRDDLFSYGSKARFLDDYFACIKQPEVVYGSSPRWGFAQISIAFLAKRHGKKATLFIAEAKKMTSYSQRAADLGAKIVSVPMGFLSVCEAKARQYVHSNGAKLLPCGLKGPQALDGIEKVASKLNVKPDEVWTAAGSGTLNLGLQRVFPRADFFAVQVGKALSFADVGRARIICSPLPFNRPTKELPPFPSVPEYDAKAWTFIPKDGKRVRLFWNVGT
jgi:hypothetical protein